MYICYKIGAPRFIKQTLLTLKGAIRPDSKIVGDLTILLSSIDRTSRQKINKDTLELNNTFNKIDLEDIRVFHPMSADYTFYSTAQVTFSKIDHILWHKAYPNKYKKLK
jgi:hypothetical protein